MTATTSQHPKLKQMLEDGYCVFENVLDRPMLDDLVRVGDDILATQTEEEKRHFRYQGSNMPVAYQDPVYAKLIAWPRTMEIFKELEFPDVKWQSAYMLSKPPHAPPLYWHQDWWAWKEPCSYEAMPPQMFLMYYLTDTRPQNGCLRVIPGSHRNRIKLHDQLPEAHTDSSYEANLDHPMFSTQPAEVDVMVKAGDLVIGDVRVLHAAHANQTEERRTCLTLWYHPDWENLPASVKTRLARKTPLTPPEWWEGDVGKPVEPLIPYYDGPPEELVWIRTPDKRLTPAEPAAV